MFNILVDFVNSFISSISSVVVTVLNFFPKSPFHYLSNSSISHFLAYLQFLIPLNYIISFLEAWLVAIGLFYVYQIVARWLKIIGS